MQIFVYRSQPMAIGKGYSMASKGKRSPLSFAADYMSSSLYNAIANQLLERYEQQASYKDLRSAAAAYMREHPDDFIPFLYKDDGDMFSSGMAPGGTPPMQVILKSICRGL